MMKQEIPAEVLTVFTTYHPDLPSHSAGQLTIVSLGGGLINHSFKITCELKQDIFLQKINTAVFADPDQLQQNYIHLWEYAEFEFTGQRMPNPVYWSRGKTLFKDKNGEYWRAFEFIEESATIAAPKNPAQAKAAAKAFAQFTAAFEEMNTELLHPVIPGFHNLTFRYSQFQTALQSELYERMAKALPLINELKARERYVHFYELITASAGFPLRVMHHDAKIANVLFHIKTGKVICPVDFDTVMPGYFFSDLGDMVRSMAGSTDENNIGRNQLREKYYEAIMEGYTKCMKNSLTDAEKKHIHYAGLLMIYMQALRFLTDYLSGDIYYRIEYPEQNFDRAINQFSLLQSLEEYLEKRKSLFE